MNAPLTGRRALLAAAAAAPLALPALAQTDRPIRWVVAYPAGGGTDNIARTLSGPMSQALGQTIVIDNRPGAAATLGADAAAKAPPDGLTVFSADPGSMVNAIGLFRRLPYDPARDFRGVGLFCDFPFAITVRRDSRYRDLAGFVEAAKRGDGAVACGTPGNGSPHHLALENFQRMAGIKLNIIPYRGGAPGMTDIIAGNLESMMLDIGTAGGAFRSGDIRALALTMPERWQWLRDVPLIRETFPEYRAGAWQGLVVPAATPDPVVRRLSDALARVMADNAVRERLINVGVEPLTSSAAEFDALLARDRSFWVPLIREAGITLDG